MILVNILFWVLIIFFIVLLLTAIISGDPFGLILSYSAVIPAVITLFIVKGCLNHIYLDSEWKGNDKCKQVEIFQISLKNKLSEVQMNCNESNINQDEQRIVFSISFNNKNHKIYFTKDWYGDPVYMEWYLDNGIKFGN